MLHVFLEPLWCYHRYVASLPVPLPLRVLCRAMQLMILGITKVMDLVMTAEPVLNQC